MRKTFIQIISILLMIVLIILPLKHLSKIFKNDDTFKRVEAFYYQPENSVDVLCVGSSRIYCNIAPSVMWSEYGISAYNYATSAQPLNLTYYALKEAFKYQNPKVCVVEVSNVLGKDEYNDQLETMDFQTGMKYSPNQVKALTDHGDKEHFMEYLLRFPCFHNNYSSLTKESFDNLSYKQFPLTGKAGFKGYINKSYDYHPEMFPSEIVYNEDPYKEDRYEALKKIKDLCDKKGTNLLLVLTPSTRYMEFEAAVQFSNDYSVPYINFMTLLDTIGINGEGDMVDEVHCNYYGATKVSRYLSQYIQSNYDVENHIGDEYYKSWDEYSNYLQLLENNFYLSKESGLGNYFNYIPNPNYVIITSLRGNYDVRDVGQRSVLAKLGCNDIAYQAGGCWVLDGSELKFYYTPADGECEWDSDEYGSSIKISNKESEDGEVKIYIDGEELIIKDDMDTEIVDGIEFVVYDKLSQKIADAVIFESINDYRIVRYGND